MLGRPAGAVLTLQVAAMQLRTLCQPGDVVAAAGAGPELGQDFAHLCGYVIGLFWGVVVWVAGGWSVLFVC